MFVLLPILAFALIGYQQYNRSVSTSAASPFRHSLLSGAVLWGILVTALTEIPSLGNRLTFETLTAAWGLVILAFAAVELLPQKSCSAPSRPSIGELYRSWSGFERLCLAGITLVVLATGLAAWQSPPNTWDSLVYHMSRIEHWIQNQSVRHFPVVDQRQLYMTPWAEFAMLHFQILSGGDHWVNLMQWLSMSGCAAAVSLVAKELGAGRREQILAATASVTISIGIIQASSSKNDYVVAFWLITCLYFFLQARRKDSLEIWFYFAASFGLALLTKVSAYIYLLPFFAWSVASAGRRFKGHTWKPLLLIVGILFAINAGHLIRNAQIYKMPWDPPSSSKASMPVFLSKPEPWSIGSWAATASLNIACQLGTPSKTLNDLIDHSVQAVHRFFVLQVDDRKNTFDARGDKVAGYTLDELYASHPIHMLLIALSLIFALRDLTGRKNITAVLITGALFFSFLLFCLWIKWSPYHSRLHLPLFVMWAPVFGLTLGRLKKLHISHLLVALLLISALYTVAFNKSRPLLGRTSVFSTDRLHQYFRIYPEVGDSYQMVARLIHESGARQVGLVIDGDNWEYPFWVLVKKGADYPIRLEHLDVRNISENIPLGNFEPEIVILTRMEEKLILKNAATMAIIYQPPPLIIYARRGWIPPVKS